MRFDEFVGCLCTSLGGPDYLLSGRRRCTAQDTWVQIQGRLRRTDNELAVPPYVIASLTIKTGRKDNRP